MRRRRQERGWRSRSHGSRETHANQPSASSVPGGRSLQPQESQGVVHANMFLSGFFLSLSWQSSLWVSTEVLPRFPRDPAGPGRRLLCGAPASGGSIRLQCAPHFRRCCGHKWLLKCQTRIYTGARPKRHPVRPKCNSAHLKDVCCPMCTWQLTCCKPLRYCPEIKCQPCGHLQLEPSHCHHCCQQYY